MEYLSAAVFSPHFDKMRDTIDNSETLSKTKGALMHQAAHASAGSVIGGLVGGPFGAMIGGIGGALIGFVTVTSYSTVFFVLSEMAADERRDVVSKFQSLLSGNVRSAVSRSVMSVRDSVTTYVSEKKQAVTGTVTESVGSVTESVVSVTGSVIAVPGNVASYMYESTCSVTSATTSAMTDVMTQNFMTRYIRSKLSYSQDDIDLGDYVAQKDGTD